MLFKKDKKIKNLEVIVKDKDKLIGEQELLISNLRQIINSLEDENKELREQAFENAKQKRKAKAKSK